MIPFLYPRKIPWGYGSCLQHQTIWLAVKRFGVEIVCDTKSSDWLFQIWCCSSLQHQIEEQKSPHRPLLTIIHFTSTRQPVKMAENNFRLVSIVICSIVLTSFITLFAHKQYIMYQRDNQLINHIGNQISNLQSTLLSLDEQRLIHFRRRESLRRTEDEFKRKELWIKLMDLVHGHQTIHGSSEVGIKPPSSATTRPPKPIKNKLFYYSPSSTMLVKLMSWFINWINCNKNLVKIEEHIQYK